MKTWRTMLRIGLSRQAASLPKLLGMSTQYLVWWHVERCFQHSFHLPWKRSLIFLFVVVQLLSMFNCSRKGDPGEGHAQCYPICSGFWPSPYMLARPPCTRHTDQAAWHPEQPPGQQWEWNNACEPANPAFELCPSAFYNLRPCLFV